MLNPRGKGNHISLYSVRSHYTSVTFPKMSNNLKQLLLHQTATPAVVEGSSKCLMSVSRHTAQQFHICFAFFLILRVSLWFTIIMQQGKVCLTHLFLLYFGISISVVWWKYVVRQSWQMQRERQSRLTMYCSISLEDTVLTRKTTKLVI